MDVKRKHYFKIDANTSSDTIFATLESIENDQEEHIENLMNDSDTEFILQEENVQMFNNSACSEKDKNIIVSESNLHAVDGKENVDYQT